MLNKLKCWLKGHKRGKRAAQHDTAEKKAYQCPRCGRLKLYKKDEHAVA